MTTRETGRGGRVAGQGMHWIRDTTRLAIYARDGMACAYCAAGVEDGAVLTLDHVVPCELGGGNAPNNLVTACHGCNSARRALSLRAWLRVLRDRGVDTDGMAARIARLRRTPVDRAVGRAMLAARAAA